MSGYGPKFQDGRNRAFGAMTVEEYAKYKIKILKRDFCLPITGEESFHFLFECKTKAAIDAYAHKLIMEKL